MALPNLRPLSFGEILDGAFTLYRRNFVTFVVTAMIPAAVIVVAFLALGGGIVAAMTSPDPTAIFGALLGGGLLVMVVGFGAWLTVWGGLTHQASEAYTGQPASVSDGLRAGFRAALPMILSGLLAFLGIMVAAIGVFIVMAVVLGIFAAMGGVMAGLGVLLAFVGWCAFMLVASAVLFAVAPAIVVEKAGAIEALERSFALARGALGRVIGLMLVTILITYLPSMAVMMVTGGFSQMMNPEAVPTASQVITQQVLGMGVSILTTPFMVAVIVLLYFDRRVRTEALDVQMMADRLAVAGD